MRKLYLQIARAICDYAETCDDQLAISQLLVVLNSEETPNLDQDMVDFLSELYIFVAFEPDHESRPSGIRTWEDAHHRLATLARSSQAPRA